MNFLKNFNIKLVAVVFLTGLTVLIFINILRVRNTDETVWAAKRLEGKNLPESVLSQINEDKFILVYLSSDCKACSDELEFLSNSSVGSTGPKVFGVMIENESDVNKFIKDKNIGFPVIRDRNQDMMRQLKLEYFPTNLVVEDGKIKRAYIGVPKNEEDLVE